MHLNRGIKIQLAIFSVVSLIAALIMVFGYIKLPVLLFGVGRYTVTVDLPRSGGLYATGNVTYRGVRTAQGRRCDPDGGHVGTTGYQQPARLGEFRAGGHPRRLADHCDQRKLHSCRRFGTRAVPNRQRLNSTSH